MYERAVATRVTDDLPTAGPGVAQGGAGNRRGGPPFLRNAYALVLNTGISGALGLAYWILAAHHYDDSDVGRGSAAISALMLLTGLVSVNFAGTLNRFIPEAGKRTFTVVALVYLITSAVVAVLAVALLFALHTLGGPAYDILREPDTRVWFIAAAVAASVITVQDSVLTGLRAAVWVPVWNAAFAVAKLVLLVVMAESMPRSGVFFSWIIPMIIVMFPVNLLIFGKLLPQQVRRSTVETELTVSQVGRFFAADYLGSLLLYGTMFLVPMLVGSTRRAAHLRVLLPGLVRRHHDESRGRQHGRVHGGGGRVRPVEPGRLLPLRADPGLGLLIIGVVGIGLAAPYALGLLGTGYLDAVPLLQLLALASLPSAVVDIYLGTLRARTKRRRIIAVQSLRAVTVLGLVVALQHYHQFFLHFGDPRLTAVGAAVLLGQLIAMLAVLPELGQLLGWRRRYTPPIAARGETVCP